jgi:hypothetical protein
MKPRSFLAASSLAAALMLHSPPYVLADDAEKKINIESLTKEGWVVAGYTSALDSRAAFILFRHPNQSYLVQCRAGYDVTRNPRTFSHCYELR